MSDADFAARVTLGCKFTGEELAQLGAEDTVSDELALLADLAGHFECEAKTREGTLSVRTPVSSARRAVHPPISITKLRHIVMQNMSSMSIKYDGHSPWSAA